ncbi:MAG: choice-of-anchor D domain-containing protein [Thermoanaerobaculales bacterium]|jgi:hypothetical protein|nr:choice-of-anchor D domain-containing protein [Thermoanaerobaculales bacterium]
MSAFALSLLIAAATTTAVPAGPPEGVFDPPPSIRHQLDEGASKRAAFEGMRRLHGGEATKTNWATELPPSSIDVTAYHLDLHVDPAAEVLSGSVTVDLTAVEDGLTTIALDADLGLRILSVLRLGNDLTPYDTPTELDFEHADDLLTITLPEALPAGAAARVRVTYGGHAFRRGLIGSTGVNWYANGGTPVIHTFAQPYGARVWWPCSDRPDDKALVSLRVTVPEDLDVAANGLERSRTDNGDGTATSVWSSKYEVPTYLVVMHISDFVYTESTYTGLDGATMPVGLWAMPPVADQAEADLAVCVPQMEVMAGHWGEYPFIDEKYGNATVFFGGGMEHQTMTTLSVYSVGDPWMEWLNVHEMGHQWWGDWVTMDDWRETWLNEGYATHTEWLWAEHLGPDVHAQYLADEDWRGWFSGPVFDNPEPFSWTIYAKGSWVVWMLRHVIGDDAFFDAMAAYREANAGATATTDDLKEAMETAGGMELDWFFDQWVYGLYRPRYVYDWEETDGPAVSLTVRQVQTNTGLFRMPMNIRVTTTAGTEDHRVMLEAEAEQTVEIPLQASATDVELNPDTHVLAEIAHVSEPDLELGPLFPDGYDFGLVAASDNGVMELPLTNTGGADLEIQGIWAQSGNNFELQDPPDFPLTIPPGETIAVEILFDPSGYGRRTDTFYIQSNDPDREGGVYLPVKGTTAIYDEGFLGVQPSVSVGTVPLGGTGEGVFDIFNLGATPIALQTTVEGSGFFLAGIVPPVLGPGQSAEIHIRFHPTTLDDGDGTMIFHAGNPADPMKTVRLSGTVVGAPVLSIEPSSLTLGICDAETTANLHLVNSGSEPLVVSVLETSAPFTVIAPTDLPVQVPPGAAQEVTIGLVDAPSGTLSGGLAVHSNDGALPVARVPLLAHLGAANAVDASFPAAANGPGLGDTRWSTRAYLLNTTDEDLPVDLVFRPKNERSAAGIDAGITVRAGSQRVISDLLALAGAEGSGGVNLRTGGSGLVAISRTFASGSGGTYGQYIDATPHSNALVGVESHVLAGLSGNGGFHTNVGVLNLGDQVLRVDADLFDSEGKHLGTQRITAQPEAFKQVVSIIAAHTVEVIRGGYATITAVDSDADYLAYASVVDDASSDPTLVRPQALNGGATDLVLPAAASQAGYSGTRWRSRLDVVNTTDIMRTVTVEYVRSDGSAVASMPLFVDAGHSMRFDDVVGGLFGETGKGWIRVTADGGGVVATSRTYNDDPSGTYGQLIPAFTINDALTTGDTGFLPGLSSTPGFRTNLGLTSASSEAVDVTILVFDNAGNALGEKEIALPAQGFVQVERILADEIGHIGEAWAEIRSDDPNAAFFAHASVVDETTGDPTFIPAAAAEGLQ